jgi:pullulanase/glycogen debranching enzyme
MTQRGRKIIQAWLETPVTGVVELARDWRARHPPPLALSGGVRFATLNRVPDYVFGCESGYFVNRKSEIFFFLRLDRHSNIDPAREAVYLAGDFNGWAGARDQEWALLPASLDGDPVLLWSGNAARFHGHPPMRFKFVTSKDCWLDVPADAPNAVRDEQGNLNRTIDLERTGQHLFRFTLEEPLDLSLSWNVGWHEGGDPHAVPLRPEGFFHRLATDLPLGAVVTGRNTIFRLFAPRASAVELCVCPDLAETEEPHRYVLKRRTEPAPESPQPGDLAVWEVTLDHNLHGWYYWYHVDGPQDVFSHFDPTQRVLDPYALAAVSREGPGIVLDRRKLGSVDRSFRTPAWQDLVIAEAHVRDLVARAPIVATDAERRGFAGLRRWVESPDFYLHRLGVNCVELQPVQEFDNVTPEEYHWGYMTNNYHAPESSYALQPERASGIGEFQELVAAFHRRGMAVILDVVYNHQGVPAHLMFVDKLYYFEVGVDGELSNWSGCGNDLRARSAMARRLIVDSCVHLIETYGVDGFRFDLAELLGFETLAEIEKALKRVKPDVILIAEPWSFRGHLAGALAATGWASWNDGYRNFVRDFVRGGGTREAFEYHLKGSPWYFAHWPAQTVNYTESHDDRAWIDVITENAGNDGHLPTLNDRRRTHLMAAVLFASIGIPMISAGQDFLRSKHGVNNTYQRGDLNALDYRRIHRFPSTHAYFAGWIAFRQSERGRLLRHFSRATEGFFRFWFAEDSTAAVVLYNADRSQGAERLLFAVNPTMADVTVALPASVAKGSWRQLADHEQFFGDTPNPASRPVEEELFVPALGCGLWVG